MENIKNFEVTVIFNRSIEKLFIKQILKQRNMKII